MVTPITSKAPVGELGPRRTRGGRLAANRSLWRVALVAALLLALGALAATAAGTLRPGRPAVSAPVPVAAAPDYTSDYWTNYDPFVIANSWPRYAPLTPAPDYTSDLGTEYDPFVIANSRPRYVPAAPAPYTAPCRWADDGCVPDDGRAPVPASPAGSGDQQARLSAIEVRDNGVSTPGGDSGPCPPLQLCDR